MIREDEWRAGIIADLEAMPDIKPRNKPWTAEEEAVLHRYWGRKPRAAVARALGRSVSSVRQKAAELDIPPIPELPNEK